MSQIQGHWNCSPSWRQLSCAGENNPSFRKKHRPDQRGKPCWTLRLFLNTILLGSSVHVCVLCECWKEVSGFLLAAASLKPQREHFSSRLTKYALSRSVLCLYLSSLAHAHTLTLSEISRSDRMWKTKRKFSYAHQKGKISSC